MNRSLTDEMLHATLARITEANAEFQQRYPGESTSRQPVHTLYGGAHLFKASTPQRLGELALASLETNAPDFITFAHAMGLPNAERLPALDQADALATAFAQGDTQARAAHPDAWLAWAVYERVRDKLRREPIEDLRIDFEDGYGSRPDDEEDQHAITVGEQLALGMQQGSLPPFIGLRIKAFGQETFARAVRTLDLAITTLAQRTGGVVPQPFVVTLPKVAVPAHVAVLADLLEALEVRCGIAPNSIGIDLMIELPQAIIGWDGTLSTAALVRAGRGRVVSVAFGTYDYTASLGITARYQQHTHPAADLARQLMLANLAGSGITLSDGVTTVMPIGPHRASANQPLSEQQQAENRAAVHSAWQEHFRNIRHSLRCGFFQSWDLHPAQVPVRYAALFSYMLESLPDAARRLNAFIERATQASLVGNTFDDAATGQGLLNFFLRGLACGAISEAEVLATGITLDELRAKSFVQIATRRAQTKQ